MTHTASNVSWSWELEALGDLLAIQTQTPAQIPSEEGCFIHSWLFFNGVTLAGILIDDKKHSVLLTVRGWWERISTAPEMHNLHLGYSNQVPKTECPQVLLATAAERCLCLSTHILAPPPPYYTPETPKSSTSLDNFAHPSLVPCLPRHAIRASAETFP